MRVALACLFSLLVLSCRKDVQVGYDYFLGLRYDCTLDEHVFSDTLPAGSNALSYCEDVRGNIIVAGESTLLKYDAAGKLIWLKGHTLAGKVGHIAALNDGGFFVTTFVNDAARITHSTVMERMQRQACPTYTYNLMFVASSISPTRPMPAKFTTQLLSSLSATHQTVSW